MHEFVEKDVTLQLLCNNKGNIWYEYTSFMMVIEKCDL